MDWDEHNLSRQRIQSMLRLPTIVRSRSTACHYTARAIVWPVATRLYLPQQSADDADRRQKTKVP